MSSVGPAWYRDIAGKRLAFHPHEASTLVGASGMWQRLQTVCPSSSQEWAVLLETKARRTHRNQQRRHAGKASALRGWSYAVFVIVIQGHLLVAHSAAINTTPFWEWFEVLSF